MIGAIEGHGENAGGGGLPHPARPTEKVRVRDALRVDRGPERRSDVILSDQLCEAARTVSSR